MNFCSHCGHEVSLKIPEGDDRLRYVCDACNTIHYQNPCIIAGCLPVLGDKILLCRRAIEPQANLWTLPAGFMENGETTEEGALRESWEEARVKIRDPKLYHLFSLRHINQVYCFYLGEVANEDFGAGPESLEVKLFHPDELPWDDIAFRVVEVTLRNYLADKEKGHFPIRDLPFEKTNHP